MYQYQHGFKESSHLKGKIILGLIALMVGISAGLYVSIRTIPMNTPEQIIYLNK